MIRNLPDTNLHVGADAPLDDDGLWFDTGDMVWKAWVLGAWRIAGEGGTFAELGQRLPSLTQEATLSVAVPVAVDGALDQTLPALEQAMTASVAGALNVDGAIGQSLPALTQAMTADVAAPGLAAPTNLRTWTITTTSIGVEWDAVAGADDYDVELDGTSVFPGVTSTFFEWTGLDPDTEYTFRVRANDASTTSDWSTPFVASTLSGLEVSAEVDQTLPALTQSATADVAGPVDAVIGQTLGSLVQAMSADVALPPTSGTITQTLGPLTQSATATVTEPAAGGDAILTEFGDTLTTEASDRLILEGA